MNKFTRITPCVHNIFMNALTIVCRGLQEVFNLIIGEANAHERKGLKLDWIYIASYILKITFNPLFIMPQCVHEHIVNRLIKKPSTPELTMTKVFMALPEYINNISAGGVMPCHILIRKAI